MGYHQIMPQQLTSHQNKYLRSLAHGLKPLVLVGKNGLTAEVIASVDAALEKHELIKLKFIEHKEKEQKNELVDAICRQTRCFRAGMIGHTAILYRQATKAAHRKITLPGTLSS
jgi:RNA-binding protein